MKEELNRFGAWFVREWLFTFLIFVALLLIWGKNVAGAFLLGTILSVYLRQI